MLCVFVSFEIVLVIIFFLGMYQVCLNFQLTGIKLLRYSLILLISAVFVLISLFSLCSIFYFDRSLPQKPCYVVPPAHPGGTSALRHLTHFCLSSRRMRRPWSKARPGRESVLIPFTASPSPRSDRRALAKGTYV